MELKVINSKPLKVSKETFAYEFNEPLIHQVVTAYLAGARAGTKAQKTRSQVSGGGVKPWRQKGTGRARAGTIRSPLWRKGGKIFAATPRDHSQKVNKKMYTAAMRSILSELVRQDRLMVIENFTVDSHKTRDLTHKLKELNLDQVLIISDQADDNLKLASRNLYKVQICSHAKHVDPVSLIAFDKVLVTANVVKQFEEILG